MCIKAEWNNRQVKERIFVLLFIFLGKKKNNHKMKNRVFVFFVMLIMFSCKEEKIEFVQSKVKPSTFLLKNLPRDDKFIKEEIKSFL